MATDSYAVERVYEVTPPWTLTASDGSGLVLTRVDAKGVVEGPLAFTELHLYFRNGESRVREGTFQITLPERAAISRFAMENNGQWMEAEVVEKEKARLAYDDFLHRRQDPALLEKAAGNQFTARVFPIAARSEKHLVISYSQELPDAQYVLPLRGLPRTERVDVTLQTMGSDGKRTAQSLSEHDWHPDRDFVSGVNGKAAVIAGDLVAARVEIEGDAPPDKPAGVTLLVDTSASRAFGYVHYIDTVSEVVDGMTATYGASLSLQVVAFDQDAELIYAGASGDFGEKQREKLLQRGAAGASDLGQALDYVASHAPHARVVLVTDGVITAGVEGAELQSRIGRLAGAKVERLDVVVAGGLRDEAAMRGLVRGGLPHAGAVLDIERDPVVAALGQAVLLDTAVEVPGASWFYPRTIESARAGSHTIVFARLAKPTRSIEIGVGGVARKLEMTAGTVPLVERAIAGAEIEELEAAANAARPDDVPTVRAKIVDKSIKSRVLSTQTSLLVLETEQDYVRYGIDRRALAEVLVVGPSGVERLGRADAVLAQGERREVQHDDAPMRRRDDASHPVRRDDSPVIQQGFPPDEADARVAAADSVAERRTAVERLERARQEQRAAAERAQRMRAVHISRECMESALGCLELSAPPAEGATGRRRNSLPGDVAAVRHRRLRSGDDDANDEHGREPWPPKDALPALNDELAVVMAELKHDVDRALDRARSWHAREPGNVLALIALGEVLEAKGSKITAARVYGSIIDLFPGRADMRRFAGERLARLQAHAQVLAIDTFRRAVADRPDHLTGHRLLAYALVRAGKHADAFAAILASFDQRRRVASFAGADRVLAEDAAMIGAAYVAANPSKRDEIAKTLATRNLAIATRPSTRFILYWETDANDVDLHVQDARDGHAFFSNTTLPSGGELYADVTTGYGPECFTIEGRPNAGPYRLSLHYFSQGPMGYGMGLLQIQRFDGNGGLAFEDRPYVIMNERAYVDLGTVR